MSPSRIVPEVGNVFLTEIDVTADWATAANTQSDIETTIGMDLSAPVYNMYFFLWEGDSDSDDFASLKIAQSSGTPTYADEFASSTPWASAPSSGIAYLIGVSMLD